ncbi:MAG: transketolase [Bdellovibrionota bacterium]
MSRFTWPQENISSETSRKALRQSILEQIYAAGSGHPGGSLSLVEIVASIFDGNFEHGFPKNFVAKTSGTERLNRADMAKDRDRLVLSKGHGVPALYSALSFMGYFPAAELAHLRQLGHFLQGHPDRNHYDLMEASTGSLGQGASVALGIALGERLAFEKKKIQRLPRVYCLLGDGEMQEGQVWEMLMAAPKFQTGNLICVIDYNKGQIDGPVKEIMDLEPLTDKLRAFRWDVHEVDGHDVTALRQTLAKCRIEARGTPHVIVANTLKGKGISFMEHPTQWHGAAPKSEQLEDAIKELGGGKDMACGRILAAKT